MNEITPETPQPFPPEGTYEPALSEELGKEDKVNPTFPNRRITLAEVYDGMNWGRIIKPLRFDLNATDLSDDRLGQTSDQGDYILISISYKVPNDLKDIIIYHELVEAETLYSNGESQAPDMEGKYIEAFLSPAEKTKMESLYGKAGERKRKHKEVE